MNTDQHLRNLWIALFALLSTTSLYSQTRPPVEYLWYEAENMRGFTTGKLGEPLLNPSYLNLSREKAPGWGINGPGVSAEWTISEYGAKTKSWYDTFRFECGNPGVCSFDEIDSHKAEYANMKRGLHDPCGSTKLKGLSWDTGKAPDNQHPSELLVRLTLDVYKFAPEKPHGDDCAKPSTGP
jgi:hypothetical protein